MALIIIYNESIKTGAGGSSLIST